MLLIKAPLGASPFYTLGNIYQVRPLEEHDHGSFDFLGNFVPLQLLLDTGRYV